MFIWLNKYKLSVNYKRFLYFSITYAQRIQEVSQKGFPIINHSSEQRI